MAINITELNSTEQVFLGYLSLKGTKVEVSYDLQTVLIDGVNRGTFIDTQGIFNSDWVKAQDTTSKSANQIAGFSYTNVGGSSTVVCSYTSADLMSVTATKVAMDDTTGQTNIPILFSNGNILVIEDDADLDAFLSVWYPLRRSNAVGYSYVEDL